MLEDFGNTNGEFFPMIFETDDDQYQFDASIENSASDNLVLEAIADTSPAGSNYEPDWFNFVDRSLTLENGPNDLPRPSAKGGQRRGGGDGGEDWFVTSDTYTPSSTSFDSSILDMAILSTRNGNSHRFMTTLSDLTSILADMGVDGPRHLVAGNLDRVGTVIGKGAQFTVFVDGIHENFVLCSCPGIIRSGCQCKFRGF
ncbi:hypothetical protein DFP73DRAFT_539559 [Morchella snyderi]|nr:hypothetical protein DFP73DRAFT_539559 [Morchella snyderi]